MNRPVKNRQGKDGAEGAVRAALSLLAYKENTKKELYGKLIQRGYGREVGQKRLAYLVHLVLSFRFALPCTGYIVAYSGGPAQARVVRSGLRAYPATGPCLAVGHFPLLTGGQLPRMYEFSFFQFTTSRFFAKISAQLFCRN